MDSPEGLSRRNILAGAATLGVSAPVLAACGDDGGDDGGGDGAGTEAGTVVAAKSDVPVGGGFINDDAKVVVTQPESGKFKAFTAVCTHQGCLVASVTDTINCDCHGSKYSITDGSVADGPAPEPLSEVAVAVKGDEIRTA